MSHEKVYLLPMGFNDAALLEEICRVIEKTFDVPADSLPESEIPEYVYNEGRGQYHSTSILKNLMLRLPANILRLLAITDADLYVTQLNFVFGEAAVDGRVCIISLCRLRPEFYGKAEDRKLFVERAVKEAIHELGHTFGLHHCQDPGCVMFFSNNIEDTDRKSSEFHDECMMQLRSKLEVLIAAA